MSHERPLWLPHQNSHEAFGLTDRERLDRRLSRKRLQDILSDDQTTVHSAEVSYNNYGGFLFLTVSQPDGDGRKCLTFYGLGFHEHRERWFTEEWFWYTTPAIPTVTEHTLPKEEVNTMLQQRLESISPYISQDTQTRQGRLFEMLADLTDGDGAYAELQDLGYLADWLEGEFLGGG